MGKGMSNSNTEFYNIYILSLSNVSYTCRFTCCSGEFRLEIDEFDTSAYIGFVVMHMVIKTKYDKVAEHETI